MSESGLTTRKPHDSQSKCKTQSLTTPTHLHSTSWHFIQCQLAFYAVPVGILYSASWNLIQCHLAFYTVPVAFIQCHLAFYTVPLGILYSANEHFMSQCSIAQLDQMHYHYISHLSSPVDQEFFWNVLLSHKNGTDNNKRWRINACTVNDNQTTTISNNMLAHV